MEAERSKYACGSATPSLSIPPQNKMWQAKGERKIWIKKKKESWKPNWGTHRSFAIITIAFKGIVHYGRDRCLLHNLRFCAFVNIGCGSVDTKNPQPLYSRDWLQLCVEFAYSQLCACPRSETLWSQTHKTCRKKNKKTKTETTETRDACLKKNDADFPNQGSVE